jgi:hypothetical protein
MKQQASPTRPSPATAPGLEPSASRQALSAYIRSRFEDFSRSQKDVAQYIVDHLDEAAFQTAEELARRASTSSSTVLAGARIRGLPGASAGRPRRVPAPAAWNGAVGCSRSAVLA